MHIRNVRGRRQEAALGAWSLTLITLALFLVFHQSSRAGHSRLRT